MSNLTVDQSGNPGTFSTIQAAINAATAGDIITVAAGTYNENILIDKPLTLLSAAGRDATIIQGSVGGPNNATITVGGGVDNVTIGAAGQGFKVIGFDRGNVLVENPAIELVHGGANATDNFKLIGNEIVAVGDSALVSAWQMPLTNAQVDGNIFSGQTFQGTVPGGPGDQFTIPNVPRQLIALGQGSYPGNASTNVAFTNNQITGVAGGVNAMGQLVGDNLVTLDASNSLISGNTFAGYTVPGRFDLRDRGTGNTITNNTIDHDAKDSQGSGFSISNPGNYSGNLIEGGDLGETLVGTPGSETINGNGGNDTIFASGGNDVVNGGAGIDIYDMQSAGAGGAFVDLASGKSFASTTGLDTLVGIESVKGSAGSDALYGDADANTFIATSGADIIDGRGGIDTFDASAAAGTVNINLNSGGAVTGAFTTTLSNVESAIGGNFDDTFIASAANNSIIGGAGFDTVDFGATSAAQAAVTWNAGQFQIVTSVGGTDVVSGVEKLNFNGADVWLVTNTNELTNALASAGMGDTIKLAPGTYAGNFVINTQGLTLESATGNADDVILQGTFRSSNGIPDGTQTSDWLAARTQAQGGYTQSAGNGLTIDASDVTINNITIKDYYQAVQLQGAAPISNIKLNGLEISGSLAGIVKENAQQVTNLDILGGSISDGVYGINLYKNDAATGKDAIDVTIDGVHLFDLVWKGIYAETLNGTTLIDNIEMDDVGSFGRIPTFGGTLGDTGIGIDINLKFGAYNGTLTIENFDFDNVGQSFGPGGVTSHPTGSAIAIKGRDDPLHPQYGINPAIITGLDIVVRDGSIHGTSTGIRLGEPGKANAGLNTTGTDVDVSNVQITGETIADVDNVSKSPLNLSLSSGDDTFLAVSGPVSAGALNISGLDGDDTITTANGNDTLNGGNGNDTLDGGLGIDTAMYTGDIIAANVVFDFDNQRWMVQAGSEGSDALKNIEIIDDLGTVGGPRILLVGAGGYGSIQSAINAANDGDVIRVGTGTYDEDLNINKAVTILGVNAGVSGSSDTRNAASDAGEVTIIGRHSVTSASGAVTIDGVRFLNDATTTGGGPSDPTLELLTGFNHKITNSIFYSSVNGAANGVDDRAIMLPPLGAGSIEISNNYVTGAFASGFGAGSWGRGIWFDGGGAALSVFGNVLEYTRTGINLDMSGSSSATIANNMFKTAGTAASLGIDIDGVSFSGNNFYNVGDEFNFRNLTTDVTFDAKLAIGAVTPGLPSNDVVVVYGGTGNDVLKGTEGSDYLDDNAAGSPFQTDTTPDSDTLEGRGGNDLLIASFGNDILDGGDGDDTLLAGAGDDTLIGGAGSDIADGEGGSDTFRLEKPFSAYTITVLQPASGMTPAKYQIVDIANGDTDQVSNVENFVFNGGPAVNVVSNQNAIVTAAGPSIVSVVEAGTDEDANAATISIAENSSVGSAVATVTANDPNLAAGDNLTFALVDSLGLPYTGPFTITKTTPSTAEITVLGPVNFEATTSLAFVVRVTDSAGHFVDQAVPVFITNVNEEPTNIALSNSTVSEDDDTGVIVGTLTTTDPDAGNTHSYTVNDSRFEVVTLGGNQVLRVKVGTALDFELQPSVDVTVRSTDQNGLFFDKTFALTVTNVNDPPIGLSNQSAQMELGATDAPLSLVAPTDVNGDPVSVTVQVLPSAGTVRLNGIALTANQVLTATQLEQLVYTAPNIDAGAGNDIYSLQFSFTDGMSPPSPLNVTLTVTPAVNGIYAGTAGANRLDGAAGNDIIDGGAGNDTLIGGIGSDHFIFRAGYGGDTITDFSAGVGVVDVISLTGFTGVRTFTDVSSRTTQVGSDTVIDFGGGDTLTLKNVLKSALVADDFAVGSFNPSTASIVGFGSSSAAGGWSNNDRFPRMVADVNGDGKADIVGFGSAGAFVSMSNGDGTFQSPILGINGFGDGASAGSWSSNDRFLRTMADVNNDGRADIVGFGAAGTFVSLANANGTFAAPILGIASFGTDAGAGGWSTANQYGRTVADVNGDGSADIIGFGGAGTFVALANGDGTFQSASLAINSFGNDASAGGWTSSDLYPRTAADVNGDGRADLVGFGGSSVYVALGNANGTFQSPIVASSGLFTPASGWTSQNEQPRYLADINDDGRADIVGFDKAGVYVALGQANGTFGPATADIAAFGLGTADGGWASQNAVPRSMGDVNGDGSADIVGFGANGVMLALANDFNFS